MARNQSNPRLVAARIVLTVIDKGRTLDAVLAEMNKGEHAALVQELSYGTLRWLQQLEFIAARLLSKAIKAKDRDVHFLLLVGLYQLRFMEIKPFAAVNETVAAARALGKPWARGLINACLRRYQREHEGVDAAIQADREAHTCHPIWLIESIRAAFPEDWQDILKANNQRPPLHLRINQRQGTREDYLARLLEGGIAATALDHTDTGIALNPPLPVHKLPGFNDGAVSVQDGAAQQAASVLDLAPGQRVLDACAAPGGKAMHILEYEEGLDTLWMVEQSAKRTALIKENLKRLRLQAEVITDDATDPNRWWDQRAFDRILLDAPCSATGVIRRHPDIKHHRSPEDIRQVAALQSKLLDALWPLLARGGKLLYITCSILPEENGLQIERFIHNHQDARVLQVALDWARRDAVGGYQILPGLADFDGFYYACLEKR